MRRRGITKQQLMAVLIASQAGDNTVIFDEFTGADGTNLVGREPSPTSNGNVYQLGTLNDSPSGNWIITGNQATKTTATTRQTIDIDATQSNRRAQCDITTTAATGQNAALLLRGNNAGYWLVAKVNNNSVQLLEFNSPSLTSRGSISNTNVSGVPDEIRADCNDATINVFVNGVQGISYSSASFNQSATRFGFYESGTNAGQWDNFRVEPL